MTYTIICADVLEWAAGYEGEKFHAILCDPPYSMKFMGKDWDDAVAMRPETWAALAEHLLPGGFLMAFGGARTYHRLACAIEDAGLVIHSAMGWLNGQGFPKATRIDTQIDGRKGGPGTTFEVVKYLCERRDAVGLSNRQIDDAFGFNGMAGHWCGFSQPAIPRLEYWPKLKEMLGLDDRFDEAITAHEREVVGKSNNKIHLANLGNAGYKDEWDITAPATPLAAQWEGHRYGLQAIKPALEFIALAQKPYEGRPVESIVETGAGALNIDGGRIGTDGGGGNGLGSHFDRLGDTEPMVKHNADRTNTQGRWPANFALSHNAPHACPECDGTSCESCDAGLVGGCKRVGTRKVKTDCGKQTTARTADKFDRTHAGGKGWRGKPEAQNQRTHADADGLEEVADWICEDSCPIRRLGEQSGERPGVKPHIRAVGSDTKSDGIYGKGYGEGRDGILKRNIPDRGTATRFFHNADWSHEIAERLAGTDSVYYKAKAARRERDAGLAKFPLKDAPAHKMNKGHIGSDGSRRTKNLPARNDHPCCKPIALTQWLATLLLPPDAYAPRRILVPFAGSGSEMLGAMLAGWDEIVGIEMMPEYVDISLARLAWWTEQAAGQMWPDVKELLKGAK